jgi:predicted kinase
VAALARENLALGVDVVVDLVNPLPVTRRMWWDVARAVGVDCVVLERFLPDEAEHRRRVETRTPDLPGQIVPSWSDVVARAYQPWDDARDGQRIRIDTTDGEDALREALAELPARYSGASPTEHSW